MHFQRFVRSIPAGRGVISLICAYHHIFSPRKPGADSWKDHKKLAIDGPGRQCVTAGWKCATVDRRS
jgi:hypothetical protein